PPAALRAKLRTDGKSAIECEFDGAVGSLAKSKGKLVLPAGKPPELAAQLEAPDLSQALALGKGKVEGLDVIESATGGFSANAVVSLAPKWEAKVDLLKSEAALKLAALPWNVSPKGAKLIITPEQIRVAELRGTVGESELSGTALQVELGKNARLSSASGKATLKLEQWFPWLKAKLPQQLGEIDTLSGSADVTLNRLALRFDKPEAADFDAVVMPRTVSATLKALPGAVTLAGGAIHADPKRVHLTNLKGALGKSTLTLAALQVELQKPARVSSGSGQAALVLEQWFPWLKEKLPQQLSEIDSLSGGAEVALNRLALRFDNPAAADYDVAVTPRAVSASLKALPAAVSVDGGAVRAGPKELALENVAVALLDARSRVSGKIGIAKPAVELALADGAAGEKIVQWGLERADLPPRFEPRTPLRFAAKRVAWAPQGTLEADARVDFDGGPQVAFALASKPKLLELPRIAIKDAVSDAVLGASIAGDVVRASFSGTLQGRSVAAMLRRPGPETASGSAQGKLALTLDRKQPQRTIAEGRLRLDALDLSWLAGKRTIVERLDFSAEPAAARLVEAKFEVDEQHFDLKGSAQRTEQGPVIDARLESPGVDLVRLLPEPKEKEEKKDESNVWPLPVTGRIEVRTGFVQYKERRIEPFEGRLSLERERARLEVQAARMCGVSFPMEVEAVPEKVTAAAHISMKGQALEKTVPCLTGGAVELTGDADLTAELKTEGRRPNLAQNLTGTVQAASRNGYVKKFALIGSILSMRNLASVSKMEQDGFPYRSMTAKGHFQSGNFVLEEGFFDSSAVRLAAHGDIDLQGPGSKLTVLVGLLTNVDRVTGAIPIVGYVFGGSMTALPVSVTGDIRNPLVVPLGPRAITDNLLGIFERTLKLPGKLVVPTTETKPPAEK
ncbi:MAG TPA: AsmA-like C-terminal region-containing protein, partial [Burkholderiales bacterium]|nr:AsmA-like C-terminal region-containing protein [Burkholderiales bacterium]